MRYVGIDYGTRYVGVALSDEHGEMAFPYAVYENDQNLLRNIKKVCVENEARTIIFGESRDYKQKENPIMQEIRACADVLRRDTHLPIYFEPEFLTSQEAKRVETDPRKTHASAAAIILQSYLDGMKNKK